MRIEEILEGLAVPSKGALVFFHVSMDRLRSLMDPASLLDGILGHFDPSSTVCMPSFPFSGADYPLYLENETAFDALRTPCRAGLLYESFRRRGDVLRSLHPLWPVACRGPEARELVSEHHLDVEPFGAKSPFGKIMAGGGILVGLGVDCNTNSFAHAPDDRMLGDYCFDVYRQVMAEFDCTASGGGKVAVRTKILSEWLPKAIQPSLMREYFFYEDFYRETSINGVPFYAMDIMQFVEFTVKINKDIVARQGFPLYYRKERLVLK